jgi:hypothetical protein
MNKASGRRIGVLAFSSCTNYGGMLQVYALQEAIARIGHIPEVVDLWPIPNNKYLLGVLKNPNVGIGSRLKGLRQWLFDRAYRLNERRYGSFRLWQGRNMRMTGRHWRTAREFAENPPELDLLEVGSDQVFNRNVSRLFLCTDVPESLARVSYGASFGSLDGTDEERRRLIAGLSKFKGLSARENSGVAFIREILGKDVPWVVDPVLLHDAGFWRKAAGREQDGREPYAFLYWLGPVGGIKDRIRDLQAQTGLKVKLFTGGYYKGFPMDMEGVDVQWGADPFDFVSAVGNAQCVASNSFHAMMFSLLFEKKAFFVTSETADRKASSTRFSDIAAIARCEGALHREWSGGKMDFFDLSGCIGNCRGMIDRSLGTLEALCAL